MTGDEEEPGATALEAEPAGLMVGMFVTWLTEHLATVEVVGARPTPWCEEWWKHPEAVARFRALWKAHVQAEANAAEGYQDADSSWWLTHWDRHAAIIFDPTNGPFRDCGGGHLDARKKKDAPAIPFKAPPCDADLL